MKKLNRTYIMGIVFIILALWVLFQTTQIPQKLVILADKNACSCSVCGNIINDCLASYCSKCGQKIDWEE